MQRTKFTVHNLEAGLLCSSSSVLSVVSWSWLADTFIQTDLQESKVQTRGNLAFSGSAPDPTISGWPTVPLKLQLPLLSVSYY